MRAQKIFATMNRGELQCSRLFLNCETVSQFTTSSSFWRTDEARERLKKLADGFAPL